MISFANELMPINRKWNLEKLMAAAREFPLRNREKITFEYVLLKGVNDSAEHARELAELLRGLKCKVNLIAFNPGPGIQFAMPEENSVAEFQKILLSCQCAGFYSPPARARHLCGMWAIEADGGTDYLATCACAWEASLDLLSAAGSSIRKTAPPSSLF